MAVKDLDDAKAKLQRYEKLTEEVKKLMTKHGITAKMEEAEKLRSSVTAFAVEHELERIDLEDSHFTLISQAYDSRFLATDDDIDAATKSANDGRKLRSMRTIIRKKFGPYSKGSKSSIIWKKITRSVIDKDALDEVVAEGLLSVDEIAPSFVEKKKSPYIRRFAD